MSVTKVTYQRQFRSNEIVAVCIPSVPQFAITLGLRFDCFFLVRDRHHRNPLGITSTRTKVAVGQVI